MMKSGHLWAIGYDDVERANQVRREIVSLGWDKNYLLLEDVAAVVWDSDGSFTPHPERVPAAAHILGFTAVGFLAGLVLGAPWAGATIGAVMAGAGTAVASTAVGIDDGFVSEVKALMKPGTSAVFVLDSEGQMGVILHA